MPNVYDFDKTVAYRDGEVTFFLFCLRRHFFRLLRFLPRMGLETFRYEAKTRRGITPKGELYHYLRGLPDWREEADLFWQSKADVMLKPWYLAQLRPDDIIISSSPEFLLRPLCDRLGVRVVGTLVDTRAGRVEGLSCFGEEKVRRLREAFGEVEIEEFYSDSLSDWHLAGLARRAWLVTGDGRIPWPE